MADGFDYPAGSAVTDEGRMLTMTWRQTFSRWQRVITAVAQSGTTANRPTKLLWVGRTYFDTDLEIPIWVQAVEPAVVWCDATGAAV